MLGSSRQVLGVSFLHYVLLWANLNMYIIQSKWLNRETRYKHGFIWEQIWTKWRFSLGVWAESGHQSNLGGPDLWRQWESEATTMTSPVDDGLRKQAPGLKRNHDNHDPSFPSLRQCSIRFWLLIPWGWKVRTQVRSRPTLLPPRFIV